MTIETKTKWMVRLMVPTAALAAWGLTAIFLFECGLIPRWVLRVTSIPTMICGVTLFVLSYRLLKTK